MEDMNLAEVTIQDHKAKVGNLQPDLADGIWTKEDQILVWLDFGHEPVAGGTIGLGIHIPAREYTKDEFLKAVIQAGTEQVIELERKYEKDCQKDQNRKIRAARVTGFIERVREHLRQAP